MDERLAGSRAYRSHGVFQNKGFYWVFGHTAPLWGHTSHALDIGVCITAIYEWIIVASPA